MQNKLPISVVIITKDEAATIADCISSASFAEEIILVDSGSTDATIEIAQKHGATIIRHDWQGYGKQKNIGMQHASCDWIFFLDADERISPSLTSILEHVIKKSHYPVYWITIEDIFLGKQMKHLAGHNPRFIKKGNARWSDAHVHERMIYIDTNNPARYKDSKSGEITEPIIHISYTSISAYLVKMHRYTTLDAAEMKKTGKHRSGMLISKNIFLPYYLALKQFSKLLVYRKGILDGWQGVTWCALSAYYEYEMGKKYLAL